VARRFVCAGESLGRRSGVERCSFSSSQTSFHNFSFCGTYTDMISNGSLTFVTLSHGTADDSDPGKGELKRHFLIGPQEAQT